MKREYEIGLAADEYCATTDPVLINCGSYSFMEGAKWADKHPNASTFWHDATEMPDTSHDRILVLHKYPDKKPFICAIDAFSWIVAHNGDWDEYVKASHIISWAYNMDLLPKE